VSGIMPPPSTVATLQRTSLTVARARGGGARPAPAGVPSLRVSRLLSHAREPPSPSAVRFSEASLVPARKSERLFAGELQRKEVLVPATRDGRGLVSGADPSEWQVHSCGWSRIRADGKRRSIRMPIGGGYWKRGVDRAKLEKTRHDRRAWSRRDDETAARLRRHDRITWRRRSQTNKTRLVVLAGRGQRVRNFV